MSREIARVVILGASGAMGSGAGAVFAAAGIPTVLLARSRDRAEQGRARVVRLAKAGAIARHLAVGTYDDDLAREAGAADLVLEAVSEDLALKREFFERIDRARRPDAIVATVSSGLSIAALAEGRSDGFRAHFVGVHLFNPPTAIVGCELIPHAGTDPRVARDLEAILVGRLGRALVRAADTPAFCGNRVGFKVLNECAQLAEARGVAYIDALIGPHTGRALGPLATIDFVGWDVHRAIVDNLAAHTRDEAHRAFALPAYMARLIEQGHLGAKTPDKGGFFRKNGGATPPLVLEPRRGAHRPPDEEDTRTPEVAARMRALHRVGRYREAFDVFARAEGPDAELMRRVVLGYVSYALGRVGEVVEAPADVDRIMGYGFNWAPPSVLVDLVGARRTIDLLEAHDLPVPAPVAWAADRGVRLFDDPDVDPGRFFHA